jgi:putative PIN family toxin of toxin-antitoxin system
MLAELVDVLSREKFSGTQGKQVRSFLRILTSHASVVNPRRLFAVLSEDPDDDVVLATAYEGKASHVVSGDRHLLNLGMFRGIRIVTVDEMLALL